MADTETFILRSSSPLETLEDKMQAISGKAVSLREVKYLTQISLRGDMGDKAFMSGARKALGVALPGKANTAAEKGDIAVLWLGPDEWLIISTEIDSHRLLSTLKLMLSDVEHVIVDLSDNRTALALSGPGAWTVLNKGSGLDFHPKNWKRGSCASSLYGAAQVLFWQRSAKPEFYLFVRNSFATYCARFLLDAMLEFTKEGND